MSSIDRARDFLNNPGALANNKHLLQMQATVQYLLDENATSPDNARAITYIIAHLASIGHSISDTEWQHHVLGPLRDNGATLGFFIGAIIGGKGMFIIDSKTGASAAHNSMNKRITKERTRLEILESLMKNQGWL